MFLCVRVWPFLYYIIKQTLWSIFFQDKNTTAFQERELELAARIRKLEAGLYELQKEIIQQRKTKKLKTEELEVVTAKETDLKVKIWDEEIQFREKSAVARQTLIDIEEEKKGYKTQTDIVYEDLDLLKQENVRLRWHLKKFQEDISEIIMG